MSQPSLEIEITTYLPSRFLLQEGQFWAVHSELLEIARLNVSELFFSVSDDTLDNINPPLTGMEPYGTYGYFDSNTDRWCYRYLFSVPLY